MTAPSSPHTPPTVPGLPLLGNAIEFMSANGIPVDFLRKAQHDYGDLVRFKIRGQSFYLVSSPELVHEVLLDRVTEFHKPEAVAARPRGLGRFLGRSILTAGHDEWRPQRKLIQPLMHTQRIARYAGTMATMGERLLGQWQDGAQRDIHADMTQVTMWIIADALFGINVDQSAPLQSAMEAGQRIVIEDLVSPLPSWLTGRDREADQVNALLTELVERFIAERRDQPDAERHDLLSVLLETPDESGQPLSDEFLRDNILTMFFAGHETTANTLTWALYYLSQYPDLNAVLQREVDSVLVDGRAPTLEDLANLQYTLMVIKETMRIQPTVATFPRALAADTELGGYRLEEGGIVLISPYVLHHDPRWWVAPEAFDPGRFSKTHEATITRYAYVPFGGGPRTCIGSHFALMEAQILLALIVRHYDLRLSPGATVAPLRQVTTFPRGGLPMVLRARASATGMQPSA